MRILSYFFLLFVFCSCLNFKQVPDDHVLALVNGKAIFLKDLINDMPEDLSKQDSASYVKKMLDQKIEDEIIYDKAKKNIPDSKKIDDMVDKYRRSLIVYDYQQQILFEKMGDVVQDSTLIKYYKDHAKNFLSAKTLVKGIFVKMPKDVKNLDSLRIWLKDPIPEVMEKLDIYCVLNSANYDNYMDKWVKFIDIKRSMNLTDKNDKSFLSKYKYYENKDDNYIYLCYINEYVLKGELSPYENVSELVKRSYLNMKKSDFMIQLKKNLLEEAEKSGEVKYKH